MNKNEDNSGFLIRSILIAIDEATRINPTETVRVMAALGAVAASIAHLHVPEPDTSSDIMGEMLISRAYRDALAVLRAPTPL